MHRQLFTSIVLSLIVGVPSFAADRSKPDDGDFTIAPPYSPAPEMADSLPHGTLHQFTMDSRDSKIYPGISKKQPGVVVPYQRKVAVWVPSRYAPGTAAPFMIVQDGMGYRGSVVPALTSLINAKRLPVMIAIMIDSGGGDARGSERGLEYDTVSDLYTKFIETEVLPKVETDCHVVLTKDPEGRATMGGSSGAACAFTMAWFHPELYRKVLSYSGTYVNQQSPPNSASPRGAWEYHDTLIPKSEPKPIRAWLEVGENDNGSKKDEASLHNWVLANRRMAAALKAKGYCYRFEFAVAAGHADGRVVHQTLPEALLWLWQDYPIK